MRALIARKATLLALLCGGLGGALYIELRNSPEAGMVAPASGSSSPSDLSPLEEPEVVVPSLAVYAPVIERPLFSPTRRPPPVSKLIAAAPMRTNGMTLKGVVLSPQRRIALIETAGSGTDPQRIAEGERLDGWTVEAVLADHAILRNGEAERRLELHSDPGIHDRDAAGARPTRERGLDQLAGDDAVGADNALRDEEPPLAHRDPETGSRLARAIRMLKAATAGSGPAPR
jgi:hypothetical protein